MAEENKEKTEEKKQNQPVKYEGKELIEKTLKKTLFLVRAIETATLSYRSNPRITRLIAMISQSIEELKKL